MRRPSAGVWSGRSRTGFARSVVLTGGVGMNMRRGGLDTEGSSLLLVANDSWHHGTLAETGIPAGPQKRQCIVKYIELFDFTR